MLYLYLHNPLRLCVAVAIELIVQHIRDLLSNRGRVTMEAACGISRSEGVFKRPH